MVKRYGIKWEAAGFVIMLIGMGGCIASFMFKNISTSGITLGALFTVIGFVIFMIGRFK
jgi:hypothetical protein